MSADTINSVLDELKGVFEVTDEILADWNGTSNLQFPDLVGMLAVKLNWDTTQVRSIDPIVRYYVRRHPDWYVTRGAKGGIMRISDKQKKDAVKNARSSAKEQLKAQLDAKVATAVVPPPVNIVTTPELLVDDDESED